MVDLSVLLLDEDYVSGEMIMKNAYGGKKHGRKSVPGTKPSPKPTPKVK